METTLPQSAHAPRAELHAVLKLVLTSGLVATSLAIFGSLMGLMFRVGWLSSFGLHFDLLLPETATELSIWSYLAAISIWGYCNTFLEQHWFVVAAGTAAFIVLIAFTAVALHTSEPRWRARLKRAQAMNTTLRRRASVASIELLGRFLAAPWIAIGMTAILVGAPLPGYFAGKRLGEQMIRSYQSTLAKDATQCESLALPSGKLAECPWLITRTKEHIIFVDGERLRVVPAAGIEFSKPLKKPPVQAP